MQHQRQEQHQRQPLSDNRKNMFGWINKKIGAAGSGSGGSGQGGSGDGEGAGGGGAGAGARQQRDQQQRDLPAGGTQQGRTGRRGSSFLDAMGGAMAIGRGGGRGKKGEKSEAAAHAEQLDAQRAEKISAVSFKLVREIQRILKEAREKQAANAAAAAAANALGASAAAAAASSSAPSPASSSPRADQAGTPAGTPAPTPPLAASPKGVGSPTLSGGAAVPAAAAAAVAAAAAAAKRKKRWAGTEELLSLLDGGSPGGAGEVEDKVERYGSIAEVQAKMSDLVEQALVPESNGDLCGQLLEAATGEGHHPAFVKLCVDAGLPSNLVHCLRIMRVIEFESAMHDSVDAAAAAAAAGDAADAAAAGVVKPTGAGGGDPAAVAGEGVDAGGAVPVGEEAAPAPAPPPDHDRPQTKRATERIGRLLVTLCRDKSAGVGEQIKPHLPGLLSLAVSAYPPNGAHVQETAREVVEALMGGCLNSSMVWLLHYNKVRKVVQ